MVSDWGGIDALLKMRRRGFAVPEGGIEALTAGAVGQLGAHDQHRALLGGSLRRSQPLDALVDVLVQRRAAVGGDDDVSGDGLHLAVLPQKRHTGFMRLPEVSREGRNRLFLLVDDHIDDVRQLCHLRRRYHVPVKGVALQNARAGIGRSDERAAVVAQHRRLIADAGQDALPPAGETGEEVRLNETLRNEQVGVHRRPVDDQRCAGGQNADLNIGFRVKGVVNDDFLGTRNFLPQLCFQLGGRCEPVETGGYQQRHPNLRIPLPELRQHGGAGCPGWARGGCGRK